MKEKLAQYLESMGVKKKITSFLIVLVLVITPAIWLHSLPVVNVFGHEQLLRRDGVYHFDGNTISIPGGRYQTEVDMLVDGESIRFTLEKDDKLIRATFDDGEIFEGYDHDLGFLLDAEGRMIRDTPDIITYVDNRRLQPMTPYEIVTGAWRLWKPDAETWGMWWYPLFISLFYLGGMATILWPEEMYFMFSRWRYQHAELSYDGECMQRLGGWVIVIGSVILMYVPLFM